MKYSGQSIKINNIPVRQVNIKTAEKCFKVGKKVFFHACNLRIDNCWQPPIEIEININSQNTFESWVNSFYYYNCDNKRGKRVIFFIEI